MTQKKLTGYPSIDKPWLKYYTEEQISAPLPHMTAVQYFESHTRGLHNEPALDAYDGKYTYDELKSAYLSAAKSLHSMGTTKGDVCLSVLPPMCIEPILLYAVNTIGAVLTGLPPQASENDLIKAVQELRVKNLFIFCDFITKDSEQALYAQTDIENIIICGSYPSWDCQIRTFSFEAFLSLGTNTVLPDIAILPEDLLFIARTGGTTGEPKSVMLDSNTFNIAVHQFICSKLPYSRNDRWLRLWPIFSATAAIASCHLPLAVGMNNIIRTFPLDFCEIDKLLLEGKSNHLTLIPQIIDAINQSELFRSTDLRYIKTIGCGGLGITPDFEKRAEDFFSRNGLSVFLGYGWGCTENGSTAVIRSSKDTTKIGTAGVPVVHTVVAAFDPETQEEKQYTEEGELCINSPTMMMGYYGDRELTEKVLRIHADGQKWLHTGDLGVVDADGFVSVIGRMTRVIFTSTGHKVYPSYLENEIANVEGVQGVAVCEKTDKDNPGFFLPICFIIPKAGIELQRVRDCVVKFCLQTFADYARPKAIYFSESFPLTKVGKVDYRALEALAAQEDKVKS